MATNSKRYPVIEAFIQGKRKRDGSAMWTDGETLYSYAMPLARRFEGSHVEVLTTYEECPSATTRYHYRAMMDLLRHVRTN